MRATAVAKRDRVVEIARATSLDDRRAILTATLCASPVDDYRIAEVHDEIRKFYEWTDPRYVYYWCDAAQTVIAGQDPVKLYNKYHDRTAGFHFKDTRHVDRREDYRSQPDPELCASTTPRWFWEMGTPGGLVDFPALMRALREHGYEGWIGVEHDKADVGGGNYPESTALAMWYARSVLEPIYYGRAGG